MCVMVQQIIQMQQREKIRRELEQMQEECVKDYLQDKLQEITSKEVIRDILQQFLQNNNREFMETISENIVEAKEHNRMLKKQLQTAKIENQKQLQQVCQAIHQQSKQKYSQQIADIVTQYDNKLKQLQLQCKTLQQANAALNQQRFDRQSIFQIKESQTSNEVERLKLQLVQSKKSFNNFKDSCEKIINQCNRQKEKEKQRLIEEWRKVKQDLQSQIQELSTNKASQEQIFSCHREILEKREQISLLVQSLAENSLQLEHINQLYIQSTNNYEKAKEQLVLVRQQHAISLRTIQSNELSVNYLKEENNYLREEILSFSKRYQQAQKEKAAYLKEIQEGKEIIKTIDAQFYSHRTKREQQQQQYKHKYENSITQTMIQIRQLKEQVEKYSNKIAEKDSIIAALTKASSQLTEERSQIQADNEVLKEQINLKIQTNEVHQLQIKHYQNQIHNMQQLHRTQMQELKHSLETQWNLKNEELIQQKYAALQQQSAISQLNQQINSLRSQIIHLKEQLRVKQQKEKYYSLLNQQMSMFSKKLSLPTKPTHKSNKDSFLYFHLAKMQNEIRYLHKQNNQLRTSTYKSIQQMSEYIQQTISYVIAKGHHNYQPTPKTEVNLKRHIQLKLVTNCKEEHNKTTQNKIGESSNFSQIKKTLKSIHQRYQTVQSQNKFYSTHLDSLIKKA